MSHRESHDEFLELCAVSTSGALSEGERARLQEHLVTCPSCREAMQQYQQAVGTVIPALAPQDFPEDLQSDPNWSEKEAEAAFFARLQQEERQGISAQEGEEPASDYADRPLPRYVNTGEAIWRHVWLQYAAGILLTIGLGFCVYEIGIHRGAQSSHSVPVPPQKSEAPLEQQLSDAGHERELARAESVQRDKTIADLRRQLVQQAAEVTRLKSAQAQLESDLRNGDANNDRLAQERAALAEQLEAAQSKAQTFDQKLDSVTRQASQDASRAAVAEAKVNELTRAIHDREQEVSRQQELLAHDRDIRDLIGARDLYIAEVYDVARTGATQKPYGRVFYTRGKSLIFYAYDLDQQVGVKNASTFQAWGRRGPDRQQAINLGIFYQDNATKKRWVLKSNDPKTLAQIDAVFVTIEPNGGSHLPSGRQLLFAYLRIDPNHP